MSLLALPNELLLLIASYLTTTQLCHLILTNHRLRYLLTALLQDHILNLQRYIHINGGGSDPNYPQLHWAAKHGYEPLVKLLLSNGFSAGATSPLGQTPLHCAAISGNEAVYRCLLESGADLHATNSLGETPFVEVVTRGFEEIARLMLDHGANPNDCAFNTYPVLHCAGKKYPGLVKLLLERGANVAAVDKNGETALQDAAWNGQINIARMLLDGGADINGGQGAKPVHKAVQGRHQQMLQFLLERGADPNSKNLFGESALHSAASGCMWDAVRLLVEFRADISARQRQDQTALDRLDIRRDGYWRRRPFDEGARQIVSLLVKMGVELGHKWTWRPWLHYAARWGCVDVVEMLLDRCVDIDEKCAGGHTALHWATRYGNIEIIDLLQRKQTGEVVHRPAQGPRRGRCLDKGVRMSIQELPGESDLRLPAGGGRRASTIIEIPQNITVPSLRNRLQSKLAGGIKKVKKIFSKKRAGAVSSRDFLNTF